MKKVLLINEGWSDNLGDVAIKYCLENLLKEENLNVTFLDFTRSAYKNHYTGNGLSVINNEMLLKSIVRRILPARLRWFIMNFKKFTNINSLSEYELVVIGGGQLILSNPSFPLAMFLWVQLFRKLNKKIYLFGVGAGSRFHKFEKILFKQALKQTNGLYIRDPESIEVVKKNFRLDGKFVPDVAFTISKFLKGKKKNKNSVKVGITDFAVYRKYNKDNKTELDYLEDWENLITKYLSSDYDLTLFYTTKEDYIQSLKFKQYLENKYKKEFIIEENSNLDELVDVISEATVLISGRMHALIIGYCYECNIIPYNISQKIRSFSNFYLDEKKDIYLLQQEIGSKVREMIGNTE